MSASTTNEPFFALLGLQPEDATTDFGRMRLPFKADLQQARGLVHGGAIAAQGWSRFVYSQAGYRRAVRPLLPIASNTLAPPGTSI
ncbi:MAG: hypothetical protein FJ147_12040 [Deltaproteobacteria bacterium]|nr:hypothetical protein [Deltaproteobacteria bacterium]